MRSAAVRCAPDRPFKILLVQVWCGPCLLPHPSFHVWVCLSSFFTWTKKIDGFPFERVASLWPSLSSLKHARPSSAATRKTAVPV